MVIFLAILILLPGIYTQQPYGLSQLDNYARLFNNENLGGLGHYQKALAQGQIRGWEDLESKPKLSGLPPLPMTHDEVVHQLTSSTEGPTTKPTARPTQPTTNAPPIVVGPYHVNPIPELPPMPEDTQKGSFDDDGNFIPEQKEEKKQTANNKIQGTKIHDFSDKKRDDIEDYESEDFYDDPDLRTPQNGENTAEKTQFAAPTEARQPPQTDVGDVRTSKQRLPPVGQQGRQPQQVQPVKKDKKRRLQRPVLGKKRKAQLRSTVRGRSVTTTPKLRKQFRDQKSQRAFIPSSRKVASRTNQPSRQILRPFAPPTAPPPTQPPTAPPPRFPPFVYRPKPKALGREEYFNNVLQEVEEYDDFLEQQRLYREQFPQVPVHNPYANLHPGQLLPPVYQQGVAIDTSGVLKPVENHEFIGTFDAKQNPDGIVPQQPQRPSEQPAAQGGFVQQPQTSLPAAPGVQQPFGGEHNLFNALGGGGGGLNLFNHQPTLFPPSATEHPLMNLFRIFELPHQQPQQQPRAHAAPLLNIDTNNAEDKGRLAPTTVAPLTTFSTMAYMPPLNPFQLVNVQQQPVNNGANLLFPNLG